MTPRRGIVLDANILIRAVFGKKARRIIESYNDTAAFCSPGICFQDAAEYIPTIAKRRGSDPSVAFDDLRNIAEIVERIEDSSYSAFREPARQRIARRDPDDWPVVAVSLMLQLPIWTEDLDFFGIGIATWVSDRVELYFRP